MATRPRRTPAKPKAKKVAPVPAPVGVPVDPMVELVKRVQEVEGRADTHERANKELRRTVRALDGRVQQLAVLVERALKAHEVFVAALGKEVSDRKKQDAALSGEVGSVRQKVQTLTQSMTEGVLYGGH